MKRSESKRIVIVDGYFTGRELLRELLARNVECFHLQSGPRTTDDATTAFDAAARVANLGYLDKSGIAASTVAALKPDAVIAGSASGVLLAERLARVLDLQTNSHDTAAARCRRFEAAETVRRYGLSAPEQIVAFSASDAHRWADRRGQWPILVKAPTAGVAPELLCLNPRDLDLAFARMGKPEGLPGSSNEGLLLQEDVDGQEFSVSTVSSGGAHYVTDVWLVTRRDNPGAPSPGDRYLLDPDQSDVTPQLMRFAHQVLGALGIENGPAHLTIKWTQTGAVFVDATASLRSGNAMEREPCRAAGLPTQAQVYAAFLAGAVQERACRLRLRHYRFARNIAQIAIGATCTGETRCAGGLDLLRTLPSFHSHSRAPKPEDVVSNVAPPAYGGGTVYLVHDDARQVAQDWAAIREWERREMLYETAPSEQQPTAEALRHPAGARTVSGSSKDIRLKRRSR